MPAGYIDGNLNWSTNWDDLTAPDHSFYGLALGSEDALYGAFSSTQSGVARTLYTKSGVPVPGIYWDYLTTDLDAGVRFSGEPNSLNVSSRTLWAIDDRDYDPATKEGCLWAFGDTLASAGPWLIEPENKGVLGCDPVSGKNQEVDLRWQQLSLASVYEIELARDIAFSLEITEAEPSTNPYYEPPVLTRPAYRILPGVLPESNARYYWRLRVRQAATGQVIRSRWSARDSFSIEPGLPVVARYLGLQAVRPLDGRANMPASSIAFSWTSFKDATEYEFILAKDAALKDILVRETVPTTAYRFSGKLDYGSSYFWQVSATKPIPSEPSAVFSFNTAARPDPTPAAPLPDTELLRWLQVSILINILGLVSVIGLIIFFRSRRV